MFPSADVPTSLHAVPPVIVPLKDLDSFANFLIVDRSYSTAGSAASALTMMEGLAFVALRSDVV